MSPPRKCVGVLFGGKSGEHNVSIKSAQTVIAALRDGINSQRFHVFPIYIDIRGIWWPSHVAEEVLKKGAALEDFQEDIPLNNFGFFEFPKGSEQIEVWFPVLHGPNGEDGTIQGLLKLMQKPFVGSSVLGSALGMDKLAMKASFTAAGLPQVEYEPVHVSEIEDEALLDLLFHRLEANLGYPCFIKPANLGSSVGISKASNRRQLLVALKKAAAFDERVVVERAVSARELECAVLGVKPLQVSVVGEIIFESDWYDYESKYSEGFSFTQIPAKLPLQVAEDIRQYALDACRVLNVKGLARVDFFYKESEKLLLINEINTIPGFTTKSMYPMLWEASGVNLQELVAILVETAGQ